MFTFLACIGNCFFSRILRKASSLQLYDTFQTPQGIRKDPACAGRNTPKCNNRQRIYICKKLSEQGYLELNAERYYDVPAVIEFPLTD